MTLKVPPHHERRDRERLIPVLGDADLARPVRVGQGQDNGIGVRVVHGHRVLAAAREWLTCTSLSVAPPQ
jgi:hypothetical protein